MEKDKIIWMKEQVQRGNVDAQFILHDRLMCQNSMCSNFCYALKLVK